MVRASDEILMDRLPSLSAMSMAMTAVVALAPLRALTGQHAALVAVPACERSATEPCTTVAVPATPVRRPNVTELREWQVGYFRRGSGARLVAAFDVSTDRVFWEFLASWGTTTLGGPPPGEWSGSIYALPDGETSADSGEVATSLVTGAPRAKWVGALSVPWDSLTLGLELLAPEDPSAPIAIVRNGAVGRARVTATPPVQPAQRLQISDILLYEHDGHAVPSSLDGPGGAAARALGSTTLGGRQRVGLYWEVYGLGAGESARVELTVAPVVGPETSPLDMHPVGVAWQSSASGGAWAQGFILDVARLTPGRHNMLVTVVVPGQDPVTAVREIRVIVGG